MSTVLQTPRLRLVGPRGVRTGVLHRYIRQNSGHFAQGGGSLPATRGGVRERLVAQRRLWKQGRAYRFYGFAGDELVLDLGLTNVTRGAFQAAHLGYRTALAHQGQGLMSEAVAAVVGFAFETLDLHRLMANHLPENRASARVLEKCGFRREGLARDYLLIEGEWRDHVLTALTNPGWGRGSDF